MEVYYYSMAKDSIIKGITEFILGVIFVVASWYTVPVFISIIPDEATYAIAVLDRDWETLAIL